MGYIIDENLYNTFRKYLANLQKERDKRQYIVNEETAWITYERMGMVNAVQNERLKRKLPPVPEELILKAEREALGHSDYSSKFALYCTEITETGTLKGPF
jgi:hypothetical protein